MDSGESFTSRVRSQLEAIREDSLDIVLQLVLREKTKRIFARTQATPAPKQDVEAFDRDFLKQMGIRRDE